MHPLYHLKTPGQGASVPRRFSFSALTEIDSCPRRWWLKHAVYDDFTGNYPQLTTPKTLMGTVVHRAMQKFAEVLAENNHPPASSPEFTQLRATFQPRQWIKTYRDEELQHLKDNPRVNVSALRHGLSVDRGVEAFKRLRHQMDNTTVETKGSTPTKANTHAVSAIHSDCPAPSTGFEVRVPALYAEHEVTLDNPLLCGTIDQIETEPDGDTITDFKTGEPKPEHEDQTRFYALLWWLKTGRPIRERQIIYQEGEPVVFGGLSEIELQAESQTVRQRIEAAQAVLMQPVPPARPGTDKCEWCPVRQLCEEYWHAPQTEALRWTLPVLLETVQSEPAQEGWRDLEISLSDCEGTGDTIAIYLPDDGHDEIRLLCPIPNKCHPGEWQRAEKLRILNVGLRLDGQTVRVATTEYSEFFWELPDTASE